MYSSILIQHDETQAHMQDILEPIGAQRSGFIQKVMKYFRALAGGSKSGEVVVAINMAKATGTVTLSAHVATDTVTINGTILTCVAAGATGNQYNVGGTDTETAANLAATINASSSFSGLVTATSASNVVTLTAARPGKLGNAVTLAISAHGSVSAARMAGGDNGASSKTYNYGSYF